MSQTSTLIRYRQLSRLTLYRLFISVGLLLLAPRLSMETEQYTTTGNNLLFFLAGLFAITLFYLFWLRTHQALELLTKLQCTMDPILITLLTSLTGLEQSPLHFLYGLAVLNTALLLGRREAFLTAGMVVLLSILSMALVGPLLHIPANEGFEPLRRSLYHAAAFLLTAFLGGALSEQTRHLQSAFEQQKDSLADLTLLHEQTVTAIPYALISINNQGIIRNVNQSAKNLLEKKGAPLIESSLESRLPGFYWAIQKAEGNTYLEFKHHDQILGLNISPLLDRQQKRIGTLLVVRNLTNIKKLEEKLASKERLALTGHLAASMAHEIRNPLASILSAAQMFTSKTQQEKQLQEIILEEVIRLKQLTTDFLVFSHPPQPKRQPIQLHLFLKEMQQRVQENPLWGPNHQLKITKTTSHSVLFDPDHLRQIFWNLLINALQATPKGGALRLQTKQNTNTVLVTLTDSGPGFDPQYIHQIFEPFFTTRSTGTGLGLSVVAQLARINKCTVHLENNPSGGAKILLTMERSNGQYPDL